MEEQEFPNARPRAAVQEDRENSGEIPGARGSEEAQNPPPIMGEGCAHSVRGGGHAGGDGWAAQGPRQEAEHPLGGALQSTVIL